VNAALRAQLRHLDRVLLALLDERARLLSEVEAGDPGRVAAIEDMLRRHQGPFSAPGVAAVFRSIDAHCDGFARAGAGAGGEAGDRSSREARPDDARESRLDDAGESRLGDTGEYRIGDTGEFRLGDAGEATK
jgi:hypothetical protein